MIDYRGHMEKYLFIKNQIVMSGLLFGGFAPMLYAATEQTQQVVVLPTIQVIGSQEDSISKFQCSGNCKPRANSTIHSKLY